MALNYEYRMEKVKKASYEVLRKEVLKFDKMGNYIEEFKSIKEAANGKNSSNIVECCKGRRKSAFGFIWKYKNEKI